jgi:hypothetical protein
LPNFFFKNSNGANDSHRVDSRKAKTISLTRTAKSSVRLFATTCY